MAVTKTTSIYRFELYAPEGDRVDYEILVEYIDSWDDPEDSALPVKKSRMVKYKRYDAEGNATDLSGEPTLVQSLASSLWTS